MSSRLACRLLIDQPLPGLRNMAVDEALLDSVADGGPPTLRFYRWSEPTLSLGYFQAYAERERHAPSNTLSVVRRSTGGGALVHHHELTYALVLPAGHPRAKDPTDLTCLAHRAACRAIAELTSAGPGVEATRLSTCAAPSTETDEPFLCFERRAEGDLLATAPGNGDPETPGDGRHKVGGSAQRRRRGAVLQHGGLLLAQSEHAPELPGLRELGLLQPSAAADGDGPLAARWAQRIAEAAGLDAEPGRLTDQETARAAAHAERFEQPTWVQRR